jgi:hypothetical protein
MGTASVGSDAPNESSTEKEVALDCLYHSRCYFDADWPYRREFVQFL